MILLTIFVILFTLVLPQRVFADRYDNVVVTTNNSIESFQQIGKEKDIEGIGGRKESVNAVNDKQTKYNLCDFVCFFFGK